MLAMLCVVGATNPTQSQAGKRAGHFGHGAGFVTLTPPSNGRTLGARALVRGETNPPLVVVTAFSGHGKQHLHRVAATRYYVLLGRAFGRLSLVDELQISVLSALLYRVRMLRATCRLPFSFPFPASRSPLDKVDIG